MSEHEPRPNTPEAGDHFKEDSTQYMAQSYGASFSNLRAMAKKAGRLELVPQIEKVGALQGLENAILSVTKYIETQDTSVKEVFSHDLGYAWEVAKPFDSELGVVLKELYSTGPKIGTAEEANYPEILEQLKALRARHTFDLQREFNALRDMLGITSKELEEFRAKHG